MELILISNTGKAPNEPELVTKMFEAGLKTFHLRKPKISTKSMQEFIEKIPSHFHNRIVIHSHHKLIFKFNLKGVHLTSVHLTREFKLWWFFRKVRLRGKKITLSRSYRKLSEVYNEEKILFNYYFLGTIFNTLSNELYSGYYEQGISAALKTTNKRFIARGGTNEITIEKAYKMGFPGVALNSYIWSAEDPFAKFIELLKYCEEKGIQID
jgi:thiamine-phosphate pyrophosphorylase